MRDTEGAFALLIRVLIAIVVIAFCVYLIRLFLGA